MVPIELEFLDVAKSYIIYKEGDTGYLVIATDSFGLKRRTRLVPRTVIHLEV